MQLRTELVLEQVYLSAVRIEPTKDEPRVRLEFKANINPEIADTLFCRDLVYAGSVPRSGVNSLVLEGEERECEVGIFTNKGTTLVKAKSVGHGKIMFEGTGPELKFQIALEGYAGAAADMAVEVKDDPLRLVLKPAQMNLPLTEAKEDATSEGDAEFMEELGISEGGKKDGPE